MRATKIALLVAGVMTSASAMAATDSERITQLEQQLATVKAQQEAARGFALDLDMGGPDADDADFRESA